MKSKRTLRKGSYSEGSGSKDASRTRLDGFAGLFDRQYQRLGWTPRCPPLEPAEIVLASNPGLGPIRQPAAFQEFLSTAPDIDRMRSWTGASTTCGRRTHAGVRVLHACVRPLRPPGVQRKSAAFLHWHWGRGYPYDCRAGRHPTRRGRLRARSIARPARHRCFHDAHAG